MTKVMINRQDFRTVLNLFGGQLCLTGSDHFSILVDRHDMRTLARNGISYMTADSPMARGL